MRTLPYILLAALLAFGVDMLLAAVAMRFSGVPRGFPPFTWLPILSGVAGGFLMAFLVYTVLRFNARQPDRIFFLVSVLALALSFALPVRLSFTKAQRFAGVTPAAQMVLVLMHTVIAVSAVAALTRAPR